LRSFERMRMVKFDREILYITLNYITITNKYEAYNLLILITGSLLLEKFVELAYAYDTIR